MASTVPRPSPVTDRVRTLILSGSRHAWSLDELHETVRSDLPTAVFSTIFRAVLELERRGLVRRVDVGDSRVRYESAGVHHEHIKCTSCGSVEEVPGCVVEEATAGVQRRTRYMITGHQVIFTGLCPRCAPRTTSRRRRAIGSA
ncbi:MAG TPA: transcriptional repressor [Candidatus Dormibacteraeota bacterium]|nr:transcriptional repressor [Candidatus Dormibacteraeota bacterium]